MVKLFSYDFRSDINISHLTFDMKLKIDSFVSISIIFGFFSKPFVCQSTKGDNVSYLLNSFQEGYDRRLRPNYGGESSNASRLSFIWPNIFHCYLVNILQFLREFCLWNIFQLTQSSKFCFEICEYWQGSIWRTVSGDPVTVGVTLYILSIGDLSEKFMVTLCEKNI